MTQPYHIEFETTAAKALRKLDRPTQARLGVAIDGLTKNPRPHGAIMLKGHHGYLRIRVGDYRIIYTVHDDVLVVVVVELGHRSEIYDGL